MSDICLKDNKLFWSPSVRWFKDEENIKIEVFVYPQPFQKLFPEFYYITQSGISENEIIEHFANFNSEKLKRFIYDLKKKKILVDSILSPAEIFYPQGRLLDCDYKDSLLIDNDALESFKKKQLSREYFQEENDTVDLFNSDDYPDYILMRKSIRSFDMGKKVSFYDFSFIASAYRQIQKDSKVTYLYASAGGLYPIDVYYYVKEKRVENIDKGLYYYDPVNNRLICVNHDCEFSSDIHYYTNQDIFSQSAFSVFYFYNGDVSMPKYEGMGYYYALIDLGIMVNLFTTIAELKNIGNCSIGEMKFEKIEKYFKLRKNQVYLHNLEAGLKNK